MTDNTLRKMAHHELVDYVQTSITGRGPTSTYIRNDGAPAVKITPYPKRRTPQLSVRPSFVAPLNTDQGPRYADFFARKVSNSASVHTAA
jgi:hypothetical protein